MDLQDLQVALPQLNDSNSIYTFVSPRPQHFSLLYPIIKYISTNPSSEKSWKKLIQTCKYFFSKNPLYPVKCLEHVKGNTWNADGEIFDSRKNIAKLWIYDNLNIISVAPSLLSSLIPKIDKCNLCSSHIYYQHLTYDEYSFLTASGDLKDLRLFFCTIKHSDGTLVTFDQLFENIHKLEDFHMHCAKNSSSMFQTDTIQKFLPRLKTLSHFNLWDLTEAFDFDSISDFLLNNQSLVISLGYNSLFDAYKEVIESFIAKLIESPPKRIPEIYFPGIEKSVFYDDYLKLCHFRK